MLTMQLQPSVAIHRRPVAATRRRPVLAIPATRLPPVLATLVVTRRRLVLATPLRPVVVIRRTPVSMLLASILLASTKPCHSCGREPRREASTRKKWLCNVRVSNKFSLVFHQGQGEGLVASVSGPASLRNTCRLARKYLNFARSDSHAVASWSKTTWCEGGRLRAGPRPGTPPPARAEESVN
jgi:hypothetical protein